MKWKAHVRFSEVFFIVTPIIPLWETSGLHKKETYRPVPDGDIQVYIKCKNPGLYQMKTSRPNPQAYMKWIPPGQYQMETSRPVPNVDIHAYIKSRHSSRYETETPRPISSGDIQACIK
jgi:hypothetical protein